MLKTIAPSLVSGALNMVSSARQYSRQKELLKKQQEYQTQERLSSQQWQQRMYDLQNRYNSPVSVMARLKEAGLSPDMYYSGAGNVAASVPGSTAGGAPSVPTPAGESSMIQGANAIGDAVLKAAQIKNLEADANKKRSEEENNAIIGTILGMDIPLKALEQKRSKQEIENLKAEFQVLTQTSEKINVEKLQSEEELKLFKESYQDRLKSIRLANENVAKQNEKYAKEIMHYTDVVEASIQSLNSKTYGDWIDAFEKEMMFHAKISANDDYFAQAVNLTIGLMEGNVSQIQTATEHLEKYGWLDSVSRAVGNVLGAIAAAVVAGKQITPSKLKPIKGFGSR